MQLRSKVKCFVNTGLRYIMKALIFIFLLCRSPKEESAPGP